MARIYDTLSRNAKILVDRAMEALRPAYDDEYGMVVHERFGKKFGGARPSLYYALGSLILDEEGAGQRAEKICNAVIDRQINAPEEIFHGCYHHDGAPVPPQGVMDYKRLGTYGRYFTDLFYERTANAFRLNLKADERFRENALEIEHLLEKAVVECYPIVWTAYEPNSREFMVQCFTMLLEHFEDKLSPACVRRIEESADIAMQGAVIRDMTDFSPLNTNVECMYVFNADYFGKRLHRPEYCQAAVRRAEMMLRKYREFHSVAEFNSPAYCSIDLTALAFWRKYGSNPRIREIGAELEKGLWLDFAEFFNPAMKNLCGPFTRAYELKMGPQSSFAAALYLALGQQALGFDEPPRYGEAPVLVLGGVEIPEEAKRQILGEKKDFIIYHQFRELSERGEPGHNDALCTATGWISPEIMTGAMSGSENPSHQLHPLVFFWQGKQGLGTVKVLRSTPEGKLNHLHTVYFDAKADRNHLTMDVDVQVNRDVKVYFEVEYPGLRQAAKITDTCWNFPGLKVDVKADAPALFVEEDIRARGADPANALRICYLSEALKPETKKMHFDLVLTKTEEE